MGDAGYRGVSADQDGRFRNKEQALLKKLAASGQFPAHFDQRVNMKDVNIDVMRPWIAERIEDLLGFEDDVVVEYVNGMLDDADNRQPDPRKMQLSLTGFLEGSTATFMSELWTLLLSAQKSIGGIPQQFVDKKKEEMRLARERDAAAITGSGAARGNARTSGRREHDDERREYNGRPSGQRHNDEQPRGARWQDRHGNGRDATNQRSFYDKSGTRTERVQDSGWGARGSRQSPPRDERYAARRSGHNEVTGRRADPPRSYGHSERGRDRDADPAPRLRRERDERRSRSVSPPPPTRHRQDEGSLTPEWRGDRSGRRRRSPSITPPRRSGRARSPSRTPPRRPASRSPTYSPSAPERRSAARSSSPSPSPPPAEREREQAKSRVKRSRWDRHS